MAIFFIAPNGQNDTFLCVARQNQFVHCPNSEGNAPTQAMLFEKLTQQRIN